VTAPTAEAAAALAATSTTALLTQAYALTHQIGAERLDRAGARGTTGGEQRVARATHDERLADLRAARDLITAEVLRRTGEQA